MTSLKKSRKMNRREKLRTN